MIYYITIKMKIKMAYLIYKTREHASLIRSRPSRNLTPLPAWPAFPTFFCPCLKLWNPRLGLRSAETAGSGESPRPTILSLAIEFQATDS